MFPKIISFKTPDFLSSFLPDHLSLNSYGFFIGLGIMAAYFIILYKTKHLGLTKDRLSELFLWGFLAAFVGGKLLFYLEDPTKYINNPILMLKNIGNGFVFYGSLLLVVPTIYFWLRYYKISFWPFMDGVAFGGPVLHSLGRVGCFLAGCCHGKICPDGIKNIVGVIFTDPSSAASITNIPIYPTQLFDIAINMLTLLVVYLVSKKQQFEGQLFLIYITLYGIGRVINENFRGDEDRGYLLGGMVTYSQFIAFVLILLSSIAWYFLQKKSKSTHA